MAMMTLPHNANRPVRSNIVTVEIHHAIQSCGSEVVQYSACKWAVRVNRVVRTMPKENGFLLLKHKNETAYVKYVKFKKFMTLLISPCAML